MDLVGLVMGKHLEGFARTYMAESWFFKFIGVDV